MGLFGYGKGTYKRNGDKAHKRIYKLAEKLPGGYEKVNKLLIDASWEIKKSYSPRADFERIAAADSRMFRYIQQIEVAVENEERAVAVAYASLLPAVVTSRYFGEPEVRERELELKEELTIARGKRDSLLDAIDRAKRGRISDEAREEYLASLEAKLSEMNERCEKLEEELGSLRDGSNVSELCRIFESFFDPELPDATDDATSDKEVDPFDQIIGK